MSRLEEQEKLVTAEGLYRRALALDDSNAEAQEALRRITHTIQVSQRLKASKSTACWPFLSSHLSDDYVTFSVLCLWFLR